jgi:hypothetical protein
LNVASVTSILLASSADALRLNANKSAQHARRANPPYELISPPVIVTAISMANTTPERD